MTALTTSSADAFRHEALFYGGEAQFVDGTASFIRGGLAAGEPVLAVVSAEKIRALRDELDRDAGDVCFADMADVGRNPARIIPAWRAFVDLHGGSRRLRGIGEPIWDGRSRAELAECQRHEALLNVAFDEHDLPALRLVVFEQADRAGLDVRRAADLVLAVHELAVNSIRHGGGRGAVRVWPDGDALVYEVADAGHIVEPLVGRL